MPLSNEDVYRLPDKSRRVVPLGHRRRGRYRKVKRKDFTRRELVEHLRVKGIHSSRQVDRVRQDGEPTLSDYRLEFAKWNDAIREAFGKSAVVDRSEWNAEYVAKMIYQFDLWSFSDYMKAHTRRPDIIPSYKTVRKRWGGFRRCVYFARRLATLPVLNDYCALSRRLGRLPTLVECRQAGVNIDRAIEFFGTRKKMDAFLEELGEIHAVKR